MTYWRGIYNSIAVIACFLFLSSVHCMDGENVSKIKEDTVIAWENLLMHWVESIGHREICALALVCKDSREAVENTAFYRKDYLFHYLAGRNWLNKWSMIWHRFGSACVAVCSVSESEMRNNSSVIMVRRNFLHINYASLCGEKFLRVRNKEAKWNSFESFLSCKQRPFFNQVGDLCVYGCGMQNRCRNIKEYCLSVNGEKKELRCVIGFKDQDRMKSRNLIEFENQPVLLDAILDSRLTHEPVQKWNKKDDPVRIYYLEGVTISEKCIEDPLFKTLPAVSQGAIVDLYNAQKKLS